MCLLHAHLFLQEPPSSDTFLTRSFQVLQLDTIDGAARVLSPEPEAFSLLPLGCCREGCLELLLSGDKDLSCGFIRATLLLTP